MLLALYICCLEGRAQGSKDIKERGITESEEEEGSWKQRVFAPVYGI